jgi:pimeloyl-ACP methyl ester carboxylesterase
LVFRYPLKHIQLQIYYAICKVITLWKGCLFGDIEYIRKTLGLTRIIVLGHSGHGYMALEKVLFIV